MAGKPDTTSAPRGASRRPPVADWRAELSPEDRKAVDDILSRYGGAVFDRVATAYSAARRKRGAPPKADERAPLLDKMAHLRIADPTCSEWRAASVVAREHATATISAGALQIWLLRNFKKDGARLLARARAAKSRPASAVAAPGRRSPVVLPRRAPPMRDIQEIARHAQAKRILNCLDLGAEAKRHLEQTDLGTRVRRHLEQMDTGALAKRHLERTDAGARVRRHLEQTDLGTRVRRHLEQTDLEA